jgi:hypothetical protein
VKYRDFLLLYVNYLYVDVNVEYTMKRLNVMVSDEAKKILVDYKKVNLISTLDETTDKFILEHKK